MSTNAEKIVENSQEPASVSNESGAATQHSISGQIQAEKYARSIAAMSSPTKGISFVKIAPPGASDVDPEL